MTIGVMQTKHDYPFTVPNKKGAPAVIYFTPIRGEPAFTIAFHELGKRRRVVRIDEADAHNEAEKIVKRLAGEGRKLSVDETRIYDRALEALRNTGMSLDDVAIEYAKAWKLTGGKVPEAALDFSRRDNKPVEDKPLAHAVKDYLAARAKDVSPHYLREFHAKLNALAESFSSYKVGDIPPPQLDDYLRNLPVTKRTRKNARAVLIRFFEWAQSRNYSPKSYNFEKEVTTVKRVEVGDIEIYSPDELRKLLSNDGVNV